MTSSDLTLEFELKRLRTFRLGLLRLHKTLLDSERVIYEQFHGRIQSPNEFFQLVISHDWFSWLRPISQFIVQIDDVLKAKEPVTVEQINALLEEGRSLLQPNEAGSSLEKRYFHAIQRDPAIALMHADLSQLLPPVRPQ